MDEIITEDGSITYYNAEYDDIYHSKSGAIEESFEKYVKPGLNGMFDSAPEVIRILDVCFGAGYNSAAAIDYIKEIYPDTKIEVVALEIDSGILDKIPTLTSGFANFKMIQEAYNNNFLYDDGSVKIRIVKEDARVSVKDLFKEGFADKFDLCFHDAFSPSKHRDLWSSELFSDIFKLMKKQGRLMTYSCARWVRDNFREAGFTVIDGPRVGRRGPATIAIKE